jgi:ankyrin repeat protein
MNVKLSLCEDYRSENDKKILYNNIIILLLRYGADPQIKDNASNGVGDVQINMNAIDLADDINLKNILIEYSNFNCGNIYLMHICQKGYHVLVKKYLPLNNINIKDEVGNTALHYAIAFSHSWKTIRYLFDAGADFFLQNNLNITPYQLLTNNDFNTFNEIYDDDSDEYKYHINILIIDVLSKESNNCIFYLVKDIRDMIKLYL